MSKNPDNGSSNTKGPKIIKVIVAFFSVSFLLFGSNALMMSYSQPQAVPSQGGELAPQLQQQLPQPQIKPASFIGNPNPPVGPKPPTGTPSGPTKPPPSVVHLRVQIDNIQVYNDRDTGVRVDGEWQLFGTVTCCGTAANSNMPTKVYSFNAPGAPEGQIDTPSDDMNDVTGTRGGNWGTVETVKFSSVYQDFDIDNTNPLSELSIDFFGIEDDRITPGDLPPIPDKTGNTYVEAAKYAEQLIVYLNNLKSVDHLGIVHEEFTKANNYGVGSHYATSSRIYRNVNYESENLKNYCSMQKIPSSIPQCKLKDWPDFPEYIINYRIIDREYRCAPGFTYNYMTNTCKGEIIS